jgi:hypothetical protein
MRHRRETTVLKWVLIGWLVLPPLAFGLWYFPTGRALLEYEAANRLWALARQQESRGDYDAAKASYEAASKAAGEEWDLRKLRIELDRALLASNPKNPNTDAVVALEILNDLEPRADRLLARAGDTDQEVYRTWRDVLVAKTAALYAIAWKNRWEGATSVEQWRGYAESALASNNRLLRHTEEQLDSEGYRLCLHNLEETVNLLRIEPAVFEGLAFPSNSPNTVDCLKKSRKYQEREQQRHKPTATPIEDPKNVAAPHPGIAGS